MSDHLKHIYEHLPTDTLLYEQQHIQERMAELALRHELLVVVLVERNKTDNEAEGS